MAEKLILLLNNTQKIFDLSFYFFFFLVWARSFIFEEASQVMSFSLAFFASLQLD